jgi:glutamate-1-semialdehyde aminotransferase
MVEIIALIVVGVMSFIAGWNTRERVAEQRMNEVLANVSENIQEHIKETVIRISIERHNNTFYVYNLDDKSFMGQGATRSELEKVLAEKYPGKSFAATHENLVEMGFANESV